MRKYYQFIYLAITRKWDMFEKYEKRIYSIDAQGTVIKSSLPPIQRPLPHIQGPLPPNQCPLHIKCPLPPIPCFLSEYQKFISYQMSVSI